MRLAMLLAILATIGGCGLKGDLYLPEEPAPAAAGTSSGAAEGEEEADEEEQP